MIGPAHSILATILAGGLFFSAVIGAIVLGLWLYGRAKKKDVD